jgi:hypothetical protein
VNQKLGDCLVPDKRRRQSELTERRPPFASCRTAVGTCYTLKPVPWRFCAVWLGVGCEFEAGHGILRGIEVPVGCLLAANNEALEGDLSQNAASGKATAFASTNESGLAKSG